MALSTPTLGDFTSKNTGTSLVVDFPSGISVDDLLLMHVVFSGGETASTPSGWTLVETAYSGTFGRAYLFRKFADSGDVSTGNVTLTTTSGATGARVLAITGHDATTPIGASSQAAGSGTDFNMGTITPAKITSMIIIFIGDDSNGDATTCSGYTNVTTPPTYTELYDDQWNTNGGHMAAAYGVRTVDTATGTLTANLSISNPGGGIAVSVSPADSSSTVTPSAVAISGTIPTTGLIVDVILNAISTFLGITSAVSTPTPTVTNNPWRNQDKNSTTWTNPNKS